MLSELFDSAARIHGLRAGPAAAELDAFTHVLSQVRYAQITARRHLRAAEHFVWWASRHDIAVSELSEQSLERFGRHVPRCRCRRYGHSDRGLLYGARLFLRHLENTGIIKVGAVASPTPEPALLMTFREWMHQQRGACGSTVDNYAVHIRELLRHVGVELDKLDARGLRQFVMEGSQTCGWAAAKKRTTALRMFVRFLIADGKCAVGLDGAIPVLAHWRLSALP